MSWLYAVKPATLTAAHVLSTTATDATPAWSASTAAAGGYAKDAAVLAPGRGDLPHRFVSLVAANAAVPGTDKSKWADQGAGNRFAMLDAHNSTRTTGTSPLVVTLRPGVAFAVLALFNLLGDRVRLEVLDAKGGVVFDQTQNLRSRKTVRWSDYYFAGFGSRRTQVVFTKIPLSFSNTVRITVTGGGVVGIGRVTMGRKHQLGEVEYGVTPFLTDYSRKEWDKDYGDYDWKVRDFSRGFRGSAVVKNAQLNSVWATLIELRAVPTLYVASEDERFAEALVTLGVMMDAPITIPYPEESLLNFTVEGLT